MMRAGLTLALLLGAAAALPEPEPDPEPVEPPPLGFRLVQVIPPPDAPAIPLWPVLSRRLLWGCPRCGRPGRRGERYCRGMGHHARLAQIVRAQLLWWGYGI